MKEKPQPLRFHARFVLTFATGRSARDVAELRAGIAELPESVIYRHTYRFLAEHMALVPEPPHDFALWASEALGNEALAEKLGAVDTLRFSSLEALRQELLRVLDEVLKAGPGRPAMPGEEFHFLSAKKFSVPIGLEAGNLAEFASAVERAGLSSLYLHLYEAKLRPPLGVNDFSLWLDQELGEKELAREVSSLDLYHSTFADIRKKITALAKARLEASHAAA